jgi:hypothetical protein
LPTARQFTFHTDYCEVSLRSDDARFSSLHSCWVWSQLC